MPQQSRPVPVVPAMPDLDQLPADPALSRDGASDDEPSRA